MKFPDGVPVLTRGDVTLRPHRDADVDAITEQCLDPEMQRWTLVPVPYRRQHAVDFVATRAIGWGDESVCSFAIESPYGAGPTGFAGSIALRRGGDAELGDVAFGAHPTARGHGVMTTAIGLLADWAFAEMGLRRISWSCIVGNLASWRVVWRNGFTFDATLRQAQPQRGDLRDCWTGSLLASDTRAPKNRWLPVPTLSDGPVRLRPLAATDEHRFLETVHDPETHYWLHEIPFARDSAAFHQRVRSVGLWPALGRSMEWAVVDAETDAYLAGIGLFGFGGLDHNSAEVGYRTHPAARGRGVMTRAMRLALAHAFRSEADGGLGLSRVNLGAGDGNTGSLAVARRAGFTETGRDRSVYLMLDGSVRDLIRFDLLAEEWRAQART